MPIYEFQCQKCQEEFEVLFRSFREEKNVSCPQCGSGKVDRLLSLFGLKAGSTSKGSSTGSGCSTCSSKKCNTCSL
ncbi:MAG: zinc ribbon domain-containing protein [Nitrospirae bacterium]|nr:zinc ribbon domain-containing protein [Nitrospirota bacterium]